MSDLRDYINKLWYDFSKSRLDEKGVLPDPVLQFEKWFHEAVEAKVNDPNAMVLSTVDKHGKPSSRVMLLRYFSEKGFVFYTNYHSRKAKEIEQNPNACLNFFWPEVERQVRVEGKLEKQSEDESDIYFQSRPRTSQLGAWVSAQSSLLKSREDLDSSFHELEKKYEGKKIPRPPFWGGYRLMHEMAEFWQGRPSRLHDRIRYTAGPDGWKIERLYP